MKTQFARGLFIKNDDNGNPCYVGNTVKVKVGEGTIPNNHTWDDRGEIPLEAKEYEGTLVLLKSKGVMIRLPNNEYIKPNLTDKGYRKWNWKLIKENV